MRVERDETWAVEANSEDEAIRKAMACDTISEQFSDLVNWEVLSAKEDP
ncbi:MAG TPA: hypothetical protein VGF83_03455 [Actinomycetota bacterium]